MIENLIFNVTISLCERSFGKINDLADSINSTPTDVIHRMSTRSVDDLIGSEISNLVTTIREGFRARLQSKMRASKRKNLQDSFQLAGENLEFVVADFINMYAFTPHIEERILASLYKKLSARERNFTKKIASTVGRLNTSRCEKVDNSYPTTL